MITRRGLLKYFGGMGVGAAGISLLSCKAGAVSAIINEVEGIIGLISTAVPVILQYAGVGSAQAQALVTEIASSLQCVLAAAQAPGATVGSVATAVGNCLKLPSLNLPAGLAANIAMLVTGIYNAVKSLIANWGAPAARARSFKIPMPLTGADRAKLTDMRRNLDAAIAKLVAK